jgi:hypothetical protein
MADTIDRLTLFPPTGDRVAFLLKSYRVEDGVLHFTNPDGHTFQTTLAATKCETVGQTGSG